MVTQHVITQMGVSPVHVMKASLVMGDPVKVGESNDIINVVEPPNKGHSNIGDKIYDTYNILLSFVDRLSFTEVLHL